MTASTPRPARADSGRPFHLEPPAGPGQPTTSAPPRPVAGRPTARPPGPPPGVPQGATQERSSLSAEPDGAREASLDADADRMWTWLARPAAAGSASGVRPVAGARTSAGLAAFALAFLGLGVPGLLLGLVGSPVPGGGRGALTRSLGAVGVLLALLSLTIWLAWAHFAACVVTEWRSARRPGPPAPGPARRPDGSFGGRSRALARFLVTTALPLFPGSPAPPPRTSAPPDTATPTGTAAPGPGPRNTGPRNTGPANTGPGRTSPASTARAGAESATPAGRHTPTGRDTPNPTRREGPATPPPATPPLATPPPASHAPARPGSGGRQTAPDSGHPAAREAGRPAALEVRQQTAPDTGEQPAPGAATPVSHTGATPVPHTSATPVPRGGGGASLLAAGLLAALAARRPSARGAARFWRTQNALRLAADLGAARFVDLATRLLSAELSAHGSPLPSVYAATLTSDALVLHLAPDPLDPPPAPWWKGAAPGTWRVDRLPDTPDGLPPGLADMIPLDTPAPFPGLATIGHNDERDWVLVDVEGAPGTIAIAGDRERAREIAVSVAVELATNRWSDDLRVFLVGFADDASVIAPGRLRAVATVDEALAELAERAVWRMHAGGPPPDVNAADGRVLRGRQQARTQALWAPDLLVLAHPPAAEEAVQLARYAHGRDHAIGVLVAGETPLARWVFTASRDGRLSLGVLGLEVTAQRLRARDYVSLLDLFQDARTYLDDPTDDELARALPAPPDVLGAPTGTVDLPAEDLPAEDLPADRAPARPPSALPGWGEDRLGASHATDGTAPTPGPGAFLPSWPDPSLPPPPNWPGRPSSGAFPGHLGPGHVGPLLGPPVRPAGLAPAQASPAPQALERLAPPPVDRTQSQAPSATPAPPAIRVDGVPSPTLGPTLPRLTVTPPPPPAIRVESTPPPATEPFRPFPPPPATRPPTTPPPTVPWSAVAPPPAIGAGNNTGPAPISPINNPGAGDAGRTRPRPGGPATPPPTRFPEPEPPGAVGPVSILLPSTPPAASATPPPPPHRAAPTGPTGPTGPVRLPYAPTPTGPLAFPSAPASATGAMPIPGGTGPARLGPRAPARTEHPPGLVEIRVLGYPTVTAPGPVERAGVEALTELVVYLALHPDGVRPGALAAALWPRDASDDTISDAVHDARRWLGTGSDGRPRLATTADGRLRLGPDISCDWWQFQACDAAGGDPAAALRLVTGPPLQDLPAGRYGWLAATGLGVAIPAAVERVAHLLAGYGLATGDTATAMAACRTGLRAVPAAEALWRDLLRTVSARGDSLALTAVVDEMYRTLDALTYPPGRGQPAGRRRLEHVAAPETNALVHTLLPGFRPRG